MLYHLEHLILCAVTTPLAKVVRYLCLYLSTFVKHFDGRLSLLNASIILQNDNAQENGAH